MFIKRVLLEQTKIEIEDLVEMNFGIVDLNDATVCLEDGSWRDLRKYEQLQVDLRIETENRIEHTMSNEHDKPMSINDDMIDARLDDRRIRQVLPDTYVEGLDVGFKL